MGMFSASLTGNLPDTRKQSGSRWQDELRSLGKCELLSQKHGPELAGARNELAETRNFGFWRPEKIVYDFSFVFHVYLHFFVLLFSILIKFVEKISAYICFAR